MADIDIFDIIQNERVITEFQPIISLKERKMVGIEALSRGVKPECGSVIPPVTMFEKAKENNCLVELDRLCRRTAVNNFCRINNRDDLILFVNLDASILDLIEDTGMSWTKRFADEAGVDCRMIAIEIVESKIDRNEFLSDFVSRHRDYGFFVTLDDFGAFHSNLDRIIKSKPNIIKIDRSLIADMNRDYYRQSIIKSIIDLSKKIGSLTLAEGLETEEDIVKCYELGVDLFQGFYFSKPVNDFTKLNNCCSDKINHISSQIRTHLSSIIENKQKQHKRFEEITEIILNGINNKPAELRQGLMEEMVRSHPEIECLFFLDANGIQSTETVCCENVVKKASHRLFSPSGAGSDHSLKDYYYFLKQLSIKKFYTDPYISLATGELCRTMSMIFKSGEEEEILCIDFIDRSPGTAHPKAMH
ncbi:EAL domain-containing protein [Limisalsivibrio acetivorans]|uniref:EAL domain-containing protein n=1 Tax=Limisalsivibrio acetivorans TaxID=1304888 RepID=UPI0003B4C2E0|nr:EAL domain-containing protein [Limisalsivibrio acetivorans]